MNITRYELRLNTPYNNWEEGDTLCVQMSTDGETFTTVYGFGPNTNPQLASTSDYAMLRMPFDDFSGQMVKMRIVWKTYSNPSLILRNINIEEKEDCDYPINLQTVSGSVAGTTASIDWDRQGNENEWELRYKTADSEEWNGIVQVLNKPYTLTGLPGQTDINVQLRAKCDASTVSRWSDTLTFRSGYTVPFTETFSDSELPSGWKPAHGTLATPTVFTETTSSAWAFYSSYYMKGLLFQPIDPTTSCEWLLMPVLDMDDGSANYVLTLYLTTRWAGDATDATYSLLVSRDGETFNEDDVVQSYTTDDMPSANQSGSISIPLRGYSGTIRPALYISSTDGEPAYLTLDSVAVTATCPADVADITLSDTTETSVKVSWTTSAETSYVFIRPAGSSQKPYIETTETSYEFTQLEPRTDYEIGITKVCEPGDTARVTIVRLTTLAGTGCDEPADVTAEAAKYSVRLSWTGEAQSYNVRYRLAGTEAWTQRTTAETSYEMTNLNDSTAYEYAIQAMCSTLESDTSAYTAIATVTTLPETCFPPTDIAVTASYDEATVTWKGSYDSYRLAYAEAATEEWTEAIVTGNEHTIGGLQPKTDYRLRLRSYTAENDSSLWSEEVSFSTEDLPECVTPSDLTVSEIAATSALLSWTAGERNLRWTLNWRRNDASAWSAAEGLTETSYELSPIDEEATYIWRVRAECELNESEWSAQNRFTTTSTGIAQTDISGVEVFVKSRILNIVNPEQSLISNIRIYTTSGQLLKSCDVETTDNVFIPLGSIGNQVLVIKITGKGCERTLKTGVF